MKRGRESGKNSLMLIRNTIRCLVDMKRKSRLKRTGRMPRTFHYELVSYEPIGRIVWDDVLSTLNENHGIMAGVREIKKKKKK
jgi:hypothetical protein